MEKMKKPVTITLSTINREIALLRRVFNWYAQQKRIMLQNPCKGQKDYKETSRERIMTEDEEQRLFTTGAPSPLVSDVVRLALFTGMRKGEILKLKKVDVHIGDLGGYILLRDTKNGENRKVPVTKELKNFIENVMIEIQWVNFFFQKLGRN